MITNRSLIGQGGGCLFGQRNCGPVVALMIAGPTQGIFELRYFRLPQDLQRVTGPFLRLALSVRWSNSKLARLLASNQVARLFVQHEFIFRNGGFIVSLPLECAGQDHVQEPSFRAAAGFPIARP